MHAKLIGLLPMLTVPVCTLTASATILLAPIHILPTTRDVEAGTCSAKHQPTTTMYYFSIRDYRARAFLFRQVFYRFEGRIRWRAEYEFSTRSIVESHQQHQNSLLRLLLSNRHELVSPYQSPRHHFHLQYNSLRGRILSV